MSLELPPVPPPPVPRPALNRPATLALGCGLGIAAIGLLVGVGAVSALVLLPIQMVPKGKVFVDGVYAKAEMNKNLTKDQLAVYEEIVDIVEAPDGGVFAVNIGGAELYDHLKDGAISEDEIKQAETVRDELKKDPAGGVMAMMSYVKLHPDMQVKINTFTRDMALKNASM